MENKKCPICDKALYKIISEEIIFEKKINFISYRCENCKEEFDFGDNDSEINKAFKEKNRKDAIKILDKFEKEKKNFAGIERALSLPQRTLYKWKNGKTKTSASGVALLKMIDLFPWLIDIAEENYDREIANDILFNYVNTVSNYTKIKQNL